MSAIIHGDLNSIAEASPEAPEVPADVDEFGENVVPVFIEAPFVDGLTVLLTTLRHNPALTETVSHITPSRLTHLDIRVLTGWEVTVLQLWALLLTDVSVSAYRYEHGVDGEISGLLDDVRVRIVGLIPGDSVPEGAGAHEWTLPEEQA